MTDTNFSSMLYEALSVADLIGDLQERMEVIRPGISRNTILLAFKQGPTTPCGGGYSTKHKRYL